MEKLDISLINCFGIGELNHTFVLPEDDNTIMIYAPNGTMKTSLARTFLCLENNHNAADLIDETKESTYSFSLDGEKLESTQVYVYKTEDNQIDPDGISNVEENNIKSFISSQIEVNLFKEILEPIENLLRDINKKFCEFANDEKIIFHEEVLRVYKYDDVLSKFDSILKAILESRYFDSSNCDFSGFFYNELFDKYGISAKYINSHYKELLNKDCKLRKKVKVGNNNRWTRLCEIVDSNSYIRSKIGDLDSLRRDYLLFFIKSEKAIASEFYSLYETKRGELLDIINKVNKDNLLWNQVVSVFNSRFHVPYHLQLENKAAALLNQDFLHIKYLHSERGIEYKGKEHFLNFVSTGEKRAYYLLVNLFEIEKRKASQKKQIIVIDDIVESFDYKNKYAVVEYLAELKNCRNIILFILTHNFDFYRTVHSRLSVGNTFIASRGNNGVITLENGKYVRDIIKNELIRNAHNTKYMIALIPFVRNIVEYTKGVNSSEYKSLTSYLHMFKETKSLTLSNLYSIICSIILVGHNNMDDVCGNYYKKMKKEVSHVLISQDEISVTNKLLLSISIRLEAEEFVRKSLPEQCINRIEGSDKYTFLLFDEYKRAYPQDTKNCSVLTKVLMMTSENIHLNNFMFEPIIDLSLEHLKELHNEVTKLKV